MQYIYAVILGLVQGIAEFLPISSSGHLALFETLFHSEDIALLDNSPLFNVLLHLATLVAVILAYRRDVGELLGEFFRMVGGWICPRRVAREKNIPVRRLIGYLILATLPLFVFVLVSDFIEGLSLYPVAVGAALIVTGVILFIADRLPAGHKNAETMTWRDALFIGIAQGFATVPGLSRSGTTISAGMGCRLERSFAVKFSFLMSLLSVLGAVCLKVLDVAQTGIDTAVLPVYLTGMVVAGVTGYFSICLLRRLVDKGRFGGFAYYCWAVGALSVVLALVL